MKNININLSIDGKTEKLIIRFEVDGDRFKIQHDLKTHDGNTILKDFLMNNMEEDEDSHLNNLDIEVFEYIDDLERAAIGLMEDFCYYMKR